MVLRSAESETLETLQSQYPLDISTSKQGLIYQQGVTNIPKKIPMHLWYLVALVSRLFGSIQSETLETQIVGNQWKQTLKTFFKVRKLAVNVTVVQGVLVSSVLLLIILSYGFAIPFGQVDSESFYFSYIFIQDPGRAISTFLIPTLAVSAYLIFLARFMFADGISSDPSYHRNTHLPANPRVFCIHDVYLFQPGTTAHGTRRLR